MITEAVLILTLQVQGATLGVVTVPYESYKDCKIVLNNWHESGYKTQIAKHLEGKMKWNAECKKQGIMF